MAPYNWLFMSFCGCSEQHPNIAIIDGKIIHKQFSSVAEIIGRNL